MPSDRVNEYLKSVCAEVRWRQAHDAVREELAAHIEDQTEAYMRSGMERETAERKAVESMGSPAETGLRLDASYRPKPQWGPVIMLTALLMISAACRFMEYGNGGSSLGKFIIAACIGCGLFVWLYNADLYRLAGLSWQAYIAVIALCLAALPLRYSRGPSEMIVLQTAAITIPALFAGWLYVCRGFGGLLTGGAMLVIPIAGMLMAPYTGAAVNVAAACLAVIVFALGMGALRKEQVAAHSVKLGRRAVRRLWAAQVKCALVAARCGDAAPGGVSRGLQLPDKGDKGYAARLEAHRPRTGY